MDLGELELSDLELEVLRSHAYLAPGFVYTASDIASALGIRRGQARQVLQKLRRLQLLDSALSASDGENGYRLSRPGQFLLMARGGPQTG
jgi:DNA-binding IscR family transcriptional regulator